MTREEMPLPGTPVLVALSGGADSVMLLRVLLDLGYPVSAAHCNYGLRLEADEDEAFVRELCRSLNLPLNVRRFTHSEIETDGGEGLQAHARRLRYAFFEELMARDGISHCATGHHADDQIETLVQNFFRSRGPHIFQPIPSKRGPYLRPLLCLDRGEIEAELRSIGQPWRHDSSNDGLDYSRNRIRHQLLPLLSELFPGIKNRFMEQAERHDRNWKWLDQFFLPVSADAVLQVSGGELLSFETLSRSIGEAGIPQFLDWWMDGRGYSGVEIGEVQRLAKSSVGATYICTRARVFRDRSGLLFLPLPDSNSDSLEMEIPLSTAQLQYRSWIFEFEVLDRRPDQFHSHDPEMHVIDMDRLRPPLRLRPWRVGDRLQPFGMKGSKLVSDVLVDQKRSLPEKERAWILEDDDGIVLLGGYRIAQRVAVSTESQRFLMVRIRPSL
ncbi:MAG: tRNA lysidine(34) synthetase TilS [Bacteroidia bacterium]